jgi:hypothetical protein
MAIKDYNTTASSNSTIDGINVAEGMSPSLVNNVFRSLAKDIKLGFVDKEWMVLGDGNVSNTYARASATSVTIGANVTATHHAGRRIKATGTNTSTTGIFGKIASSSYSAPNTTINFTFDSGSIHASDSAPVIYLGSTYVGPATPVIDEDSFSSNTAIIPPSQQSTKAFIESGTTTFTNKRLNSPKINEDVVMSATATELNLLDGATTTTAEINYNDTGASVGTVVASKSVIADANKDVASFRNITLTGELDAGSLDVSGNADIDGTLETDGLSINGTTITSTGAELNILDGVTSTTAELNILDGVTATTAELNIIDGVTSTTAELNILDGVTATTTEINIIDGVTATTAELNIMDGVTSTTAEINYTDGVTSNIQTQLDAKVVKASNLSDLASASTSRTNLGLNSMAVQASNAVSISGGAISGLSDPSSGSSPATKTYTDNLITGLKTRVICRVATTGNVDLTADLQNSDTIDGISISTNNKVLVKNQSTASQNGIYKVVSSGTSSRDPDFDTAGEMAGQMVIIQEGTQADTIWLNTNDSDLNLGSTSVAFTKVTPSNTGTISNLAITGSEFSIGNSPLTSNGTITLAIGNISASKIGGTTNISDTEYNYLNGVTSAIQTQLDAKATTEFSTSMAIALG